jgi:hypothetical protein
LRTHGPSGQHTSYVFGRLGQNIRLPSPSLEKIPVPTVVSFPCFLYFKKKASSYLLLPTIYSTGIVHVLFFRSFFVPLLFRLEHTVSPQEQRNGNDRKKEGINTLHPPPFISYPHSSVTQYPCGLIQPRLNDVIHSCFMACS